MLESNGGDLAWATGVKDLQPQMSCAQPPVYFAEIQQEWTGKNPLSTCKNIEKKADLRMPCRALRHLPVAPRATRRSPKGNASA